MTIGEFSALTGIGAYTLRYYEKKGLLWVSRDKAQRRDYHEENIEWVKFIKRLKDTGMLFRDMKYYSDLRYEGDHTIRERLELLVRNRMCVVEEQRKWEEYLRNLDEKISIYEERIRAYEKN